MLIAKTPEYVHCRLQCFSRFKFLCSSDIQTLQSTIYAVNMISVCEVSTHENLNSNKGTKSLTGLFATFYA